MKVLLLLLAMACMGLTIALVPQRGTPPAGPSPHAVAQRDRVQPGDMVIARNGAVCGSSVEAFDQLVKWAAQHNEREMLRVLTSTRSSLWTVGSEAKVLDTGFTYFERPNDQGAVETRRMPRTKIRILKTQRDCWVPSEAVQ